MARVVKILGTGGQRQAEKELGWNRGTVRKGLRELERGQPFVDNFSKRGRKPIEERLPRLLDDIKMIVETLKVNDPVFLRTHYYIGISAAQVRDHLVLWSGYKDEDLPTKETIRLKMLKLNYRLKRY